MDIDHRQHPAACRRARTTAGYAAIAIRRGNRVCRRNFPVACAMVPGIAISRRFARSQSSRTDDPLIGERKFAAEKEVLRFDRSPWFDRGRNRADKVSRQASDHLKESDHTRDHAQWIAAASTLPCGVDRRFAQDRQPGNPVGCATGDGIDPGDCLNSMGYPAVWYRTAVFGCRAVFLAPWAAGMIAPRELRKYFARGRLARRER